MGTKEKLIARFKSEPRDFTFEVLIRLLGFFGFTQNTKGKTSGSRVCFTNGHAMIILHKPHPSNIVKQYEMKAIAKFLIDQGLI